MSKEVINRRHRSGQHAAQLSDDEVSKIYNTIKNIINEVSTGGKNHEPIVILLDDKPQEALLIITQEAAVASKLIGRTVHVKQSYMDAVDEVLSNEIMDIGRNSRTVEPDRQIAYLSTTLKS